jgi:hypothetical protein
MKQRTIMVGILSTSVALSPQVNYTDWSTATCRRNLVPTFANRWVSRGQRGGSLTAVNLSFLGRSRYFFQVAPHIASWGWVDPVPDPLLRRKFRSAGNRTQDLWVSSQELWPLDHRCGRNVVNSRINWYITVLKKLPIRAWRKKRFADDNVINVI